MDIEKIVREYIDKSVHMSLATSKDNKPWVSEVHFAYDDQLNLYFRSLKSKRHSKEIADNPNVAGDIVRQHNATEAVHGVYFEGLAELMSNPNEREKVYPLFESRLETDRSILEEAMDEDNHQFYKITVNKWYAFGQFGNSSSSEKYELNWNNNLANS